MDKVLRQFLEVATLKNVTHAANKLCMNQSTLSINIKRLEESLGVPLLIRSSSGVELTEFGHVVLEEARIMQRLHDNTLTKIEFLKERLERELKVGSGHAEWHLFVRDSVRTYRQRHPSANIHTEVGNNLRLMDQLLSGDLDLSVGNEIYGLNRNAGVLFIPLYQVTNKAFVRAAHPLALRSCTADDLKDYPAIHLTPNESRYYHVMDELYLKEYGSSVHMAEKIVYSSNTMEACIETLEGTNAILFFPGSMESYFSQFNIVSLQLTENQKTNSIGIYMLRERHEDPQLSDMLQLMQHNLKERLHLLV
ncbi:transcriptional regulator, LysR family [Tolumonas auensis DSM 9187]|uniref:Transcriptional regulator, LysR family n=1 Tax=Tolumonas auensis (strain DSM 9187 / NBRC 110442 / TA 4) TaxID=595494 RepID=C4L7J2_TOLAT|nr:LysR family transcriptional regulator [Tolumonas auensis]ACQ93608.1 transcriptional regulator, LysR family [Tolumonas auensis DSM 9187]